MVRILSKEDLLDICDGAAILGTGGGGSPDLGKKQVSRDFEAGKSFRLIDLVEMPDESPVFCPAGVGTIAPQDPTSEEALRKLERKGLDPLDDAFNSLQDHIGEKAGVVIPFELGGRNTARALSIAARFGIPCLDGDPVGRAVPELEMTSFSLHDVKLVPCSLSDFQGDIMILKSAATNARVEAVARSLAISSSGRAALVAFPCRGAKLRNIAFPGTISKCLTIGRAAREAILGNRDPVDAVLRACNGFELFRGTVASVSWKDEGGFMIGDLIMNGSGPYANQTLKIWYKNENHITYLDGAPFATSPDLISILDESNGQAITNTSMRIGSRVVAMGVKCEPPWRTREGIALLGPSHFGFEIEYRAIEKLVKKTVSSS